MNFFLSCVHELSKSIPSSSGECDYSACMWNFSVQLANSIFDVFGNFVFFGGGGAGVGGGVGGNQKQKSQNEGWI